MVGFCFALVWFFLKFATFVTVMMATVFSLDNYISPIECCFSFTPHAQPLGLYCYLLLWQTFAVPGYCSISCNYSLKQGKTLTFVRKETLCQLQVWLVFEIHS